MCTNNSSAGIRARTCNVEPDKGEFSSSEAKTRFKYSDDSVRACFNQVGSLSHSILLRSSIMIALALVSSDLLIPLTSFQSEALVESNISAT